MRKQNEITCFYYVMCKTILVHHIMDIKKTMKQKTEQPFPMSSISNTLGLHLSFNSSACSSTTSFKSTT